MFSSKKIYSQNFLNHLKNFICFIDVDNIKITSYDETKIKIRITPPDGLPLEKVYNIYHKIEVPTYDPDDETNYNYYDEIFYIDDDGAEKSFTPRQLKPEFEEKEGFEEEEPDDFYIDEDGLEQNIMDDVFRRILYKGEIDEAYEIIEKYWAFYFKNGFDRHLFYLEVKKKYWENFNNHSFNRCYSHSNDEY